MVGHLFGFANAGEEPVDDDLDEPDLAQHPEGQRSPEQEKNLRRFHGSSLLGRKKVGEVVAAVAGQPFTTPPSRSVQGPPGARRPASCSSRC